MTKWSSGQVRSQCKGTISGAGPLDRWTTRPLPVGITMGDAAGIGPEIILKALAKRGRGVKEPRGRLRIIGSKKVFEQEQKRLGTRADLSLIDDSVKLAGTWRMGRVQRKCGAAAMESLEAGVEMLESGAISALVTAPVSKEALRLAGFAWPGQTEFLAERLGVKRYAMLAWTPAFKAVFVTIHLPLAKVSRHITAAAVAEKARLLDEFLRREMRGARRGTSPSIGVLAFNPHGEEFTLGEEKRIAAGVALARASGIDAAGPIPADAALAGWSSARTPGPPIPGSLSYDGFVAMYHDQAMIPAKLLGKGAGVNVTLGLECVRASPLHGVAFDIAGKGIASPDSMIAAVRLARRLSFRRPPGLHT